MVSRRRKHTDFPTAYYAMLDQMQHQSTLFIPLVESDARSQIHDLYRFFRSLDAAYRSDTYAQKYADIARDLMLTFVGGEKSGINIRKRPLVAALGERV